MLNRLRGELTPRLSRRCLAAIAIVLVTFADTRAAETDSAAIYRKNVAPILEEFCGRCHMGETKKGGIAFDQAEGALLQNRELWLKSLKMLRAGMMPPRERSQPTADQIAQVEEWIKRSAFGIDPKNPDPGRVTIRRLNRVEYRNTIRDLMGIDFNTDAVFPADDTGHGFDNNGDVLTISPLLLEKYVAASRTIVSQSVPNLPWVVAEKRIPGRQFKAASDTATIAGEGPLPLSYYKPITVAHSFKAEHAGRYQLLLDLTANETYVEAMFDYNKCRLTLKADGQVLHQQEYVRQGGKLYHYELDLDWKAGDHELTLEIEPLTKEKQIRSLTLRIVAVTVRGPLAKEHWVRPPNYERYFPAAVPEGAEERRAYSRLLLEKFATKAFRRPVDGTTLDRLVKLSENYSAAPGRTFEAGIAQAVTVVLASPRFLFREEGTVASSNGTHPLIDEHALASRLSYFLWSSMPDDELFRLAGEKKLRENLAAQVKRMLADPKSGEFVKQFVGQWLLARAVDSIEINARAVMSRDDVPDPKADEQRARFRELVRKPPESLTEAENKELESLRGAFAGGFRRFAQFELNGDLRRAMRRETEMLLEHIVKNDRTLLELLNADYTFLNERLAKHYGIEGVTGDQMRLVKLPGNSPRGGVITQGSVLAVTSNPDRTSPVKRGLFILENILGTPPAPPPPDIPSLEEAAPKGKPVSLRESLKRHRADALCSSCHNRMDPLGLALENFNALGMWREKEAGQPIDAAGQLITGESFTNVRELKAILTNQRRLDYYRCLTEKMMIYALGRGLEYYDVQAVDEIVAKLDAAKGSPSVLLAGIIESAPFQKRRAPETGPAVKSPDK